MLVVREDDMEFSILRLTVSAVIISLEQVSVLKEPS